MPPLHLNQAELAAHWRISPRTLERWRCAGKGPRFLKLGSRVVYRIADIEAFEATRLYRRTDLRANRKVEDPPELFELQRKTLRAFTLRYAKIVSIAKQCA